MDLEARYGPISEPLTGRRWSPADIHREVDGRAASYARQGVRAGDRVLLLYGNCIEFFADLLALWKLGCCAVPVDPGLTAFEIGKVAEGAGTRLCIAPLEGRSGDFSGIPDARPLRAVSGEAELPAPAAPSPRPEDDALIIFTSGSTGEPKGVVHTHASLQGRFEAIRRCIGTADFARTLCIMPTHAITLVTNCLYPWLSGNELFITPPYDAMVLMKLGSLVDAHDVTFFVSVPPMWSLVLKAAPPPKRGSLRRIHSVSAILRKDTWEGMQRWSGTRRVVSAYGSTETASWATGVLEPDVVPEDGLVGVPWGGQVRVTRIVGSAPEDVTLDACAAGESGMVWIAGPGLMRGYLDHPDLTDEVLRDGWYMTGDTGHLDDRGRLFIEGRTRDEINRGGVKIFPADIDHVAAQCGAVDDACTFRIPDELYGENVAIALVLKSRSPAALAETYRWMESRLARRKMPARWYLVDSLPRAHRGKINRDRVARHCESLSPVDMAAALRESRR